MTATEKVFAFVFKDIDIAFHTIGAGSAPGPFRKYSIAKVNYFYDKVGEDIEE